MTKIDPPVVRPPEEQMADVLAILVEIGALPAATAPTDALPCPERAQ